MAGPAGVEVRMILAHQQEHPIIVWNDMIVDGRNRFRACEMLGRKPKIKEMQFADEAAVISYIISTNMRRRHLTNEQRDQIGARLVTMQHGGDRANPQNAGLVGVTAAAAMVQSTPARIERARTIERADPKLAEKVISGEISKGAALRQIKHARERTKPLPAVTDYANADHFPCLR